MNVQQASWFLLLGLTHLIGSSAWACHEGGPMGFASDNSEAFSVDFTSSSTYAFASTSGTMGCEDWSLSQQREQDQFLWAKWELLAEEAARQDQDLHWQTLAHLAGCNSVEASQWMPLAGEHFATLFDDPNATKEVRNRFRLQFNQHLTDARLSCRLSSS